MKCSDSAWPAGGGRWAWLWVLLLSATAPVVPAVAETAYVTDMLQLELYANRDLSGGALDKLRSGEPMEVLERDGRVARVRLDNGQSGWVKSLYLVTTEPARTRVNALEAANERLESSLDETRAELERVKADLQTLRAGQTTDAARASEITAELERVRAVNNQLQQSARNSAWRVPLSLLFGMTLLALLAGAVASWYWIDSRSRAKHGGYRVY